MDTKRFLVNGKWIASDVELPIYAPYDKRQVGAAFQANTAYIEEAISGSLMAFREAGKLLAEDRQRILQSVSDGIRENHERFSRLIAEEAGKPLKAARVETERAIFTFALAAQEAMRVRDESIALDVQPGIEKRKGTVRRFPAGVVTAITPFNFPLNLVAHKVAPAIACGCPVILKPAPQTPLTALALAELIQEAGLPAGHLQVLPLRNEDTAPLIEDDRIKVLSFTGSAAVGWELKSRARKKRVLLELGGNAAVIIHNDADIGHAATRCAAGGFSYAGQSCISVQRILVERRVYSDFLSELLLKVKALRSGDPLDESTDVGPLIRQADAIRVKAWIDEAIAEGAKALCGGERNGPMVEPTVLTNTKPAQKVNREEIFGPVVTVEPYDSFESALVMANDSKYGLQAGVFTADRGRIDLAFQQLEVGGVIVNEVPTFRADQMPYGGVKDSGLGREGVKYAMEEMTERKILVR
ncbi:MAG TPA: aldehyde dehydrogenase family protein [Terriglobales bacterium]|nr:aldehyde dehydrogenase family protein [Terriglobales bacterium]